MKTILDSKVFLGSAALAGFASAYLAPAPYAVVAGVTAMFALTRCIRRIEGERNWAAVMNALKDYEEIIGGQLWTGRDADILASDRADNPAEPGPIRYEHICRTKSGSWFIFEVAVQMGRVVFRELRPCDEATAQRRLERHQAAYVSYFGHPSVA